jgi:DNA repair exonuclease SbcCD ATPase subunit
MKNIFMAGAICALVFFGLNADGVVKGGKANAKQYHGNMKKLHAEVKVKFDALNSMCKDIQTAVTNKDDKGAVKAISAFLNKKHDLTKEFQDKAKKLHEEMRKKHDGKEHDANLKKHLEGMKKFHEEMKGELEKLDAILKSIKDAADKGNVKGAVAKISEYLDQKHTLCKEMQDRQKKHHEKMEAMYKKNPGKGLDAKHKKYHPEWMKKAHADMHKKFAELDSMLVSIKIAVDSGNIHGAIAEIAKYIDEKHKITKSFNNKMEQQHKKMHKKISDKDGGKNKHKDTKKNVVKVGPKTVGPKTVASSAVTPSEVAPSKPESSDVLSGESDENASSESESSDEDASSEPEFIDEAAPIEV